MPSQIRLHGGFGFLFSRASWRGGQSFSSFNGWPLRRTKLATCRCHSYHLRHSFNSRKSSWLSKRFFFERGKISWPESEHNWLLPQVGYFQTCFVRRACNYLILVETLRLRSFVHNKFNSHGHSSLRALKLQRKGSVIFWGRAQVRGTFLFIFPLWASRTLLQRLVSSSCSCCFEKFWWAKMTRWIFSLLAILTQEVVNGALCIVHATYQLCS